MNATQETMMVLTEQKLYWAIGRCYASHAQGQRIKVRRITKSMVSVKTPHSNYVVDLAHPKAGLKLGRCTCKGAQGGRYCYHLAAAAACPGTVLHEAPRAIEMPTIVWRTKNACETRATASTRQLSGIPSSPTEQPQGSPSAMRAAYGIEQTEKPFPWQNKQDAIAEALAQEMLDTYAPGWRVREPFNANASTGASPTEAEQAPLSASAHTHNCQACGRHFNCDFTEFCWDSAAVVCETCYAAGKRVWDAPGPVVPVTIAIAQQAHVRAC
jgi:hypothetical protein